MEELIEVASDPGVSLFGILPQSRAIFARPTQILCTDDEWRPRKAWVMPIASPHSPALRLSNAYLNANIGVGRRPDRRLRVRHVLSRRRSLGYLFVEAHIYFLFYYS